MSRLALRAALVSAAVVVASCGELPMGTGDGQSPPPAPTELRALPVRDGVDVSWKNPSVADFERVVAVRYGPGADTGKPSGQPIVGETIAGGTVVYTGAGEAFGDTALPAGCGPFRYHLWSKDSTGLFSAGPASAEVPRGSTTPAPVGHVGGLQVMQAGGEVQLSWTNPPASTGWFQTVVVRTASAPATSTADGVPLYAGNGTATREAASSLPLGVAVTYSAFACNACGGCVATPASVTFTRRDSTDAGSDAGSPADAGRTDGGVDAGPQPPTGLMSSLSVDGQLVQLRWALSPGTTQVKVLRLLNSTPAGPNDPAATVVSFDGGTQASERVDALLPATSLVPRTYTYAAYGCAGGTCEATGARTQLTLTLTQALRGGGYTLAWRHATASDCADNTTLGCAVARTDCALVSAPAANWWKSCTADCANATARQLTQPTANQETTTIHQYFATNGVTFGRVLSGEFCRTVQTAQGLNLGPVTEQRTELTYYVYDEARRCQATHALLNQVPASGTNTALVGHAGFTCPTLDALAWSEAAIYKPQPATGTACSVTDGGCATDEACVAGSCVHPLLVDRVLVGGWSTLP